MPQLHFSVAGCHWWQERLFALTNARRRALGGLAQRTIKHMSLYTGLGTDILAQEATHLHYQSKRLAVSAPSSASQPRGLVSVAL
jgi:hypothetical protein